MTTTRSIRFRRAFSGLGLALVALVSGSGVEADSSDPGRSELAPGLVVRRLIAPPTADVAKAPVVTLVHVDPQRFDLELLTASQHGGLKTPPQWLAEYDLMGVINASMFLPNHRSTGLMINGDTVNNGLDNRAYSGFLGFGPRANDVAPVVMQGRDCENFDLSRLKDDYEVVIQNYRLLDCDGDPIEWRDAKVYSVAGVGLDERDWLVFFHTGSPYRTRDLARWLARDEVGLQAAVFVEGGTQAALLVESGDELVQAIGSRGYSIAPAQSFRPIPNVIGFRPKQTP